MLKKILLILIFITSTSTAQQVLPPDVGIYHSVMPGFNGTEDEVTEESITSFVRESGKLVAWVNFSNNWYKGIKFPKEEVKLIYSLGSIPFIRLMPRSNYKRGKDKKFSLDKIIKGEFDDELREWAYDARTTYIPLILDFAPEMNGKWFQWNGSYYGGGKTKNYGDKNYPDGPEKYRDAYRHIIELFREEKVNNVTWAFHVNAYHDPDAEWNSYKYYYPGDKYIDWIGVSVYGPQFKGEEWMTFEMIMDDIYHELSDLSENKPLAVFEMGVTDDVKTGNKAEWILNAFTSLRKSKYPRIRSVSWWNENFKNEHGNISRLKINSSPESLNAYKHAVNYDFYTPFIKLSK